MINSASHFIIDQGNTVTKIALFQNGQLVKKASYGGDDLSGLTNFLSSNPHADVFISSVRAGTQDIEKHVLSTNRLLYFERKHTLPFALEYSTPETIGLDRLANAAGVIGHFGKSDILIIDCGSCITTTFLKGGVLKGGAISPGLRMRLSALHTFTGRLPQVKFNPVLPLLTGDSTTSSIASGVVWGVIYEIRGIIEQYCSENQELNVIITGGDGGFLGCYLKSPIFADENLTLQGLHQIYLINYCEKII